MCAYVYTWNTATPLITDLVRDGAQEIRENVKGALNERLLSVFVNLTTDPLPHKTLTTVNNTYDIGSTAARFKAGYINALAINNANTPSAGSILMANLGAIQSRNAANSTSLAMLYMDGSDVLNLYAGVATLTSAGALTTNAGIRAGAATTIGWTGRGGLAASSDGNYNLSSQSGAVGSGNLLLTNLTASGVLTAGDGTAGTPTSLHTVVASISGSVTAGEILKIRNANSGGMSAIIFANDSDLKKVTFGWGNNGLASPYAQTAVWRGASLVELAMLADAAATPQLLIQSAQVTANVKVISTGIIRSTGSGGFAIGETTALDRINFNSTNANAYTFLNSANAVAPIVVAALTASTGTFSGTVTVNNPTLTLGNGVGNSGSIFNMIGWAGGNKNWQISTANIGTGIGLAFTPSTAGGGSTFTTAVAVLSEAGALTLSGGITVNGNILQFQNGTNITKQSNGVLTVFDDLGTSFGRLQFGGTTNAFPAIKRSSATLAFRLADDSGDAGITAASITTSSTTLHTTSVALTNGAAAAAGTLTNAPAAGNPTKWVPINDNGTTRYIPAW